MIVLSEVAVWLSLPVLALLVGILLWRKPYSQFPYFLLYVIVGELTGLVRLLGHRLFLRAYFGIYWTSDVLVEVFAFLATYELFVKRLFPRFYLVPLYRYLFPAVAIVVTLIAVPAAIQARKVNTLLVAIHAVEILRVTVLAFFVGLMIFMGRRWTRYEFGIALGLGIQASVLLITSTIWTKAPLDPISKWLPVIGYDIACLTWLVTFLRPERPAAPPIAPVSPEVLEQARKWKKTLKESLTTKKPQR